MHNDLTLGGAPRLMDWWRPLGARSGSGRSAEQVSLRAQATLSIA